MSLPIEITEKYKLIEAEIERNGAELLELRYRSWGGRGVLELIVDKPDGITLDDCAKINESVGRFLEEEAERSIGSIFSNRYYLEVNSPGLDRPLKTRRDFERAKGEFLKVTWKNDLGQVKTQVGKTEAIDDAEIVLREKNGVSSKIPLAAIVNATREIGFGKS